jgi:UDP-N-acetylmuramyl pentapeptide phosphotransferase/UDP-N-acetylglucosamine-1-phosphate transferase
MCAARQEAGKSCKATVHHRRHQPVSRATARAALGFAVFASYNASVQELLFAFFSSAVVTMLLVHSVRLHGHHSGDHDFAKPQGFHERAVPRIGGLSVVVGLALSAIPLQWDLGTHALGFLLPLMCCGAVAFAAGFIQDFTGAIAPKGRLFATGLSAVVAFYWMGAEIRYTGIPGLDWLVSFSLGSLAVSVLATAGVANAINIIDGLNGLASMCVVLMLSALTFVAFQVGDPLVARVALGVVGAVLGMFLWNYPAGLIFLGDGGAYFLGFMVAELSILLLVRNPEEVSPMFPLLLCIYPIFETLFSIYRRWFLRALPPTEPDGIHLHSLVYRRVIRWAAPELAHNKLMRNSMSSPYLWLLCGWSVVPAVVFWNNTPVLAGFLLLFVATYVNLYWRIVRFRSPRWLILRR